MKTIVKNEANPCLQDASNAKWTWDEFRNKNYAGYLAVRQQALEEQANECAYTGLWLGEGTTQKVHLDHFRKKGIYPDFTFHYANLFAAAKDLPYGSDYKDKNIHGPVKKADGQYATFWSPLKANLVNAFWYRQDGYMVPDEHLTDNEKEMAQNTIDMYNLNNPDLTMKRKGIIQVLHSLNDCEADVVRECMNTQGFSFLVENELRNR